MREIEIVARIRKLAERNHHDRGIVRGIGDDCAILRPSANEDLVFTSDFVLEGRHFALGTHTPADIGHKALARSLSDLAAMGSEPVFCLVSLAVRSELGAAWINGFYRGLLALAAKFRITLAGGDLARFDRVAADVICCGRVPRGEAILRSGANPGDRIYCTGELGAAAHGLSVRRGKHWRRHLRPEPRIQAGIALRRLGASAAIDVSDGLALDLHRLCVESKAGADLNSDLPIASGAKLEDALYGGDDYELLFTASPKKKIPGHIGDLRITRIGDVILGSAGVVKWKGRRLEPKGFDHFA
jgi:thiamine-monophosphate kinase